MDEPFDPSTVLDFLFPFAQLGQFVDQLSLCDLDITDLPITFVEQYKVGAVITGSTDLLSDIFAVQVIDRLHLVTVPLLSVSREFTPLLHWVVLRYYKGVTCKNAILNALRLYLQLSMMGRTSDLYTEYKKAKVNFGECSLVSINEMDYVISECDLLFKVNSYGNEIPELVPSKTPNVCLDNMRTYYMLLPCGLFWLPGFNLHCWGFVE